MQYAEYASLLLIVLFITSGCFFLAKKMARSGYDAQTAFGVWFITCLIMAGATYLMIIIAATFQMFGRLFICMYIASLAFLIIWVFRFWFRWGEEINTQFYVLFVLYILAVSVVTLSNREAGMNTDVILVPFQNFSDPEKMRHFLLNVGLLAPAGFFFCLSSKKATISYVLALAILMPSLVEATQLIFKCGECDINDIIANGAGFVIGYGIAYVACKRILPFLHGRKR